MNCRTVQNQLSAYLDRELTGSEMLAIRGHLMECRPCRAEEESLRTLKRLLAASTVPEPSADLADRLCASVLAGKPARPSAGERSTEARFGSIRNGVFMFAGVAACSMALTYSLYSHAWSSSASPAQVVAGPSSAQDLTFDVQRDEVFATGLDATSGVPVLLTPQNAGR